MSNRIVFVLLDRSGDTLSDPAREAITLARGLGTVTAVAIGDLSPQVLAHLGDYGVSDVRVLQLPAAGLSASDVARAVVAATADVDAQVGRILLTQSSLAHKEIAAGVAHAWRAALVVDAHTVTADADQILVGQQSFAGAWDVVSRVVTPDAVVALRANSVAPTPAPEPVVCDVRQVEVEVRPGSVDVVSRAVKPAASSDRPPLASAAIVVAGGRGTGGDFGPVFDLADAAGAAVGATRDVVYEGWFDQFIGQTGVMVAPRVYIGAGVSGAPHHRGGMQASQVIVAVNNDPECPLFEISDFAVVGDLADVLSQAATAIREYRQSRSEVANRDTATP